MSVRARLWFCVAIAASGPGLAHAQLIPQGPRAHPSVIGGLSFEPELVHDLGYVQPLSRASSELSVEVAGVVSLLVLVPPEPEIRGALVALASLNGEVWR